MDELAGDRRLTDSAVAWTEGGPREVSPGVHRLPLPLEGEALRAVNVYAIEAASGWLLIDAGWTKTGFRAHLVNALAELSCSLDDIRRFLVTHIHRDHYGQAVAVRREFGTPIALGVGERPAIDVIATPGWDPPLVHFRSLARCGAHSLIHTLLAEGYGQGVDAADFEAPDEWLHTGTVIDLGDRTLEVVATPGHTQGHVVFVDAAAGLLFAGDHVLPHMSPSIGFEPVAAPAPLTDYLQSLARVRAMPDTRLLPAHGPVTESVHQRIDELLDHHRVRLDAARAELGGAGKTAYDVAVQLRWTRRGYLFETLNAFNQMLAVLETAAHLDVLVVQQRASVMDGEVRSYVLVS